MSTQRESERSIGYVVFATHFFGGGGGGDTFTYFLLDLGVYFV